MEYLAGSIVTLLVIYIMTRLSAKSFTTKPRKIIYNQSRSFDLAKEIIYISVKAKTKKPTQTTKHQQSNVLRVLVIDNKAYWISDNSFYEAEVVDGEPEKESAKVVDVMGMDAVELDKMFYIVKKLREGLTDDSGNSGKP